MITSTLETERLILRTFAPADADAVLAIYGDDETTRFLGVSTLKTRGEAQALLREICEEGRGRPSLCRYAICRKEDGVPVGYIHVSGDESRDMGYVLRRDMWRRGYATEAGLAVAAQLRRAGEPYITATHDVNNPRSGGVMRRLGMVYRYSYEEQWQPQDIPVTFRMYQLNLDADTERVYRKYWEQYPVHFVEPGL